MSNPRMGKESGDFGTITYNGNTLTIEIDSGSIGSVQLTSGTGRRECFWDGNQWVCTVVIFGGDAAAASKN